MPTSADSDSTEKEVVINGKSDVDEELTAVASEGENQGENTQSEAAQTESLSDWLVMVCVFLCNVLNGLNFTSYGVMYLSITEMFQSTRAAVGWIMSFDIALAAFLGELYSFVGVYPLWSFDTSVLIHFSLFSTKDRSGCPVRSFF